MRISAGPGEAGQSSGRVERTAPKAAVHSHGLTSVEADPDGERLDRIGDRLVDKRELQVDRGPDRLPRRIEDRQRISATKLDYRTAPALDLGSCELGECRRKPRRGLVASSLRKGGEPADIRDQERLDAARLFVVRRSDCRQLEGRILVEDRLLQLA